jgi:glycosyltransferase involved in cell wall biosynthesis
MHPGDRRNGPAEPRERPQVSIVIPNHNYARFLPACLRSIADQRLDTRRIEIIFVDDASSDGSAELAQRLLPDMPLAGHRVLCLPRTGRPGPVRNAGLDQARGLTLLCLDPDDLILPDFLPRCLEALDRGADVAYTDYFLEDHSGRHEVRLPGFHKLLLANQNILSPSALFRREFWDRGARFRAATFYEDWDFWVQLALSGARFVRLEGPRYVYRFHQGNFSFTARAHDAESKARLVLDNAAFFPSWTLGWARGVLRGEPWADPMTRGIIPVLPEQAARPVAV